MVNVTEHAGLSRFSARLKLDHILRVICLQNIRCARHEKFLHCATEKDSWLKMTVDRLQLISVHALLRSHLPCILFMSNDVDVSRIQVENSCEPLASSSATSRDVAPTRCTGRVGAQYNPWQPQGRPPQTPALNHHSPAAAAASSPTPCYNGYRSSAAPTRFSSRRTPFSSNDSPPPRPHAAEVSVGRDHRVRVGLK